MSAAVIVALRMSALATVLSASSEVPTAPAAMSTAAIVSVAIWAEAIV
jgi:hypothetical protein